jgi:hypothetical protein
MIVQMDSPPPTANLLLLIVFWCFRLPPPSSISAVVPLVPPPLVEAIVLASNASRSRYLAASITSTITNYQVAQPQHTLRLLKPLRHRHGSEPSTGFEDSGHLLVGDISNFIFGSPALPLLDTTFKLLKPTLHEALPQHWLHASATPL